jgi:hypothetical protein
VGKRDRRVHLKQEVGGMNKKNEEDGSKKPLKSNINIV